MSYVANLQHLRPRLRARLACRPPAATSASPPPSPPPASPSSSATSACASSTAPPAACSRPSRARIFYQGAGKILDTIDEAEAAVADVSQNPRGSLHVAAPLGIGKRLIAPLDPRLQRPLPRDRRPPAPLRPPHRHHRRGRSTSRSILGPLEDSNLRVRPIADCRAPALPPPPPTSRPTRTRAPATISLDQRHACLLHRYPGAREFVWTLVTPDGPQRFEVSGPLESDDGDVLTAWALAGRGIILKPAFEIAEHLASGALVPVGEDNPPLAVRLACLYPAQAPAGPQEPPLHRLHGRRLQARAQPDPRGARSHHRDMRRRGVGDRNSNNPRLIQSRRGPAR